MADPERLSDDDKQTLLRIARETLQSHLSGSGIPDFNPVSSGLMINRPAFVTLRKKNTHELRGCRGETMARQPLIESVKKMAIASAVDDPRFKKVTFTELDNIHIEINALTPMHPIKAENIIIGKHGLMLIKRFSAGLLLPAVPLSYNWDKDTYLNQLCLKAGLPKNSWQEKDAELLAFESEEWEEE